MLQNRIIPVLLLQDGGLVKTIQFAKPRYIGDPLNTLRLFNEKEVDEIILLDIDATTKNRAPDFELIEHLASECFMPLCYGGGVSTFEHVKRLFALGIEKIAFGTAAFENPNLLQETAARYGRQSVVGVMDIKHHWLTRKPFVGVRHLQTMTPYTPSTYAHYLVQNGVGEILLQNTSRDGTFQGYDIDLIQSVTKNVDVPVIALGGAGSVNDLGNAIQMGGASAAAAGSLFVFQGVHRAVLVNYPTREILAPIRS
jgi:cyclase